MTRIARALRAIGRLILLGAAVWLALDLAVAQEIPSGDAPPAGDVAVAPAGAAPGPDDAIAEDPVPDEWNAVAERAEEVLTDGRASTEALEDLRRVLNGWRGRFDSARDLNAARIGALRNEIAALGEPPAEGGEELPEIADQRATLNGRLDVLTAPVREAEAAFVAVDGLIAGIDDLIERRRAATLTSRDPSPINPVGWLPAVTAAGTWMAAFAAELTVPFRTATARAAWMDRGVELGFLFTAAVLLLWRSGVWSMRIRDRLIPHEVQSPGARIAVILLGAGRALLPVLGLVAVTRILFIMGATGLRAEAAVTVLPTMGLLILGGRWLAGFVFPSREHPRTLLALPAKARVEGWLLAVSLSTLAALSLLLDAMAQTSDAVAESRHVLSFLLILPAGIGFVRLGKILVRAGGQARTDDDESQLQGQLLTLLGRALGLLGIVVPLLGAAGYVNLAEALTWPAVGSLALLSAIGVAQEVVFDCYALLKRRADTARDALAPTLIGFALVVLALPLFALIWGVRPSRLGEWWGLFRRGITLGETQISPGSFLTFAIVFAIGWGLVRLVKGVLRSSVLPKTRLDAGGTNAILSGTGYVGIVLAALLAITTAGIDLSGLAIVAGALSVGVGFGLQTIVQNFVSGVILLIERPVKLGDWINVNGTEGFVRQISVRSTRIETFDRQDVIVPNADLIAGVVTNYTHSNSSGRLLVTVGVAYGADTRKVQAILEEVAQKHPMIVLNPPPLVTFDGFGADSLNFTIRIVIRDILFKPIVTSEINHAIAERFRNEGLEIPFAQRDLWLRNPEALREALTPQPAEAR